MSRRSYAIAGAALAAACLGVVAHAQQVSPPPFATTKVDGTDNVYLFRYGNHQSMFVVTSAGVIATDPIGYGRPQNLLTFLQDASAAVKTAAQAGKCWDAVEKELKLPKYESWQDTSRRCRSS